MHEWRTFLVPKVHRVVEFLTTQGIATAGRLFYGFLCVRLLPISDYAKFVVVFGFLGTLTVLMDICFSTTLLPLVGEHVDDKQLIADYVASIRQFGAPAIFGGVPFGRLGVSAAGPQTTVELASCHGHGGHPAGCRVVRPCERSLWCGADSAPRSWILVPDAGDFKLGSLTLLGLLWTFRAVNAFTCLLISLAAIAYVGLSYYFRARKLLGVAGHPVAERRKAIIHLALPIMPNTIFYAFQGQISLILITLFGHVSAVASVGALGRLGQIFLLFGQMSPLLIEPYFARLPKVRLKRNYLGMLALQSALCVSITGLAWYLPGLFLWVLGHKYSGLRFEVFLMIAGSSAGYLSGMLWVIHCSRRFMYWWSSIIFIFLALTVQVLFIWKVDLSTVRAVLVLNLAISVLALLVNVFTGIYGFLRGPRKTVTYAQIQGGNEFV